MNLTLELCAPAGEGNGLSESTLVCLCGEVTDWDGNEKTVGLIETRGVRNVAIVSEGEARTREVLCFQTLSSLSLLSSPKSIGPNRAFPLWAY